MFGYPATAASRLLPWPQVIRYYAAADISAHTELTIFYGSSLWFETNEAEAHASPAVSSDEDDGLKMLARVQL